MESAHVAQRREPWNKGKLVGQKAAFKLKEIWAIRVRLQMYGRLREVALFDLGIDSKLRACGRALAGQEPPVANGSWHGVEVLAVHGQVFMMIGPPVAFHPEWPLFMYFASNPASRSLMAVLQPTWKP